MIAKGYELINSDKIPSDVEVRTEGVRCGLPIHRIEEWSENVCLALYDKRKGLIRKDGVEILHGIFWHIQTGMPHFVLEVMRQKDAREIISEDKGIGIMNKGVIKNSQIIRNQFRGVSIGILNTGEMDNNTIIKENTFESNKKPKTIWEKTKWPRWIIGTIIALVGLIWVILQSIE